MSEPVLFSPLKLRGLTLPNRVVVSPMCQYSAVDGFANDWHLVNAGSRAVGGAGLFIVEATGVEARGRISPGDLGIWSDDHIAPLRRIVDFLHSQGTAAGIQLAHAGRKASCDLPWLGGKQLSLENGGWQTVAPSAIPFYEDERAPAELTKAEIAQLVSLFADAARRALAAGFDVIEIHGAHGYLLSEFLSPLANRRTDEYGGSFENRIRLPLEITDAIRAVWPADKPLFYRITASDWADGGWTIDDTVRFASILKQHGVDLMDCSSGGTVPHVKIPVGPGYQVPFADRVRNEAGLPTGAVGAITEAAQAEAILSEGKADLVLLAREMLREPYWAILAAKQLGAAPRVPPQYSRAL
ncbi:NADH:flavin oxidoreductase/NADH oxidase [uncultured Paludibaculum sp.]|uniref:NADH:flavin oxidoreductase/NADH oxidase n=1 Tax=uncultured Paludibaculum sp. TaxID=1765020 RepID=UPI002AAAD7CB|nr:NADH:flavin oxidoreductase/NADH oxidase [uncultured Paludibaculum sp.]